MNFSPEILNELKSISPLLAGIEKATTLSVPEGYFTNLAEIVTEKINTISLHQSKNIKFSVPDGYFENLSTNILQEIKSLEKEPQQELRESSPMLYSIQGENVFTVPKNYFSDLSDNILERIKPQQKSKVIPLKRNTIFRYASAAIVTGAIAVASFFAFNHSQSSSQTSSNPATAASYINTASQFKTEQQVNNAIADLPTDEIVSYLETTGNDADNEAIISNVNESQMPAPKDYLLNGETLDKYLNTIGAKQND